jgi:hypothetical protein
MENDEDMRMEEPESLGYKRSILEYWTLVEFFSPYILEHALSSKHSYQKIYADQQANEPLPWLRAEPLDENDSTSPFAKRYHLYLALFSIEETADYARHTFAPQPSEWSSVNWRSCAASNTLTCFARLAVTAHGIPLLGTLSLSTLPWAHGCLLDRKADFLTLENYWKSINRLLLALREEFSPQMPRRVVKNPEKHAGYLDFESLTALVQILNGWAGFAPQGYPLVLIEPLSASKNSHVAKEPQIKNERDVPILNSFYIQDLEAAAVSLSNQQGKPIDRYLSHSHEGRVALESEEGQMSILETLRPLKTPSGRWPDALSHRQSLMQQFAINGAFDSLKIKGLFSVNGPPGTGKTSLLREVIAENIVARAEALAQFTTAQSAFIGRQALNFENCDPIFASELAPELLGYEMLVVSSNNTAVQNLSQELPLRYELDPSFRHASYLETVATKALGSKAKAAWGLIAATLGNMENCRRFVENVFITKSDLEDSDRIWEWVDSYSGPTFSEVKSSFIAIKNRHEQLSNELEILAILHAEVGGHTVETYCAKQLAELISAEEDCEKIQSQLSQCLTDEIEAKELLALLKEREKLWKLERPSLLKRLVGSKGNEEWLEKSNLFRKERLAAIDELHRCKSHLKELRTLQLEHSHIESDKAEDLLARALHFHAYQESYLKLKEAHPTVRLPAADIHGRSELDEHLQAYYQTDELNRLRSELFIAAMALHEAWLAETSRVKGGFRGNLMAIAQILQGKNPTTSEDTRLAWQSAFLLLPVISSTFASIGRLFRYLEPGTLGWLLIDEAGQAIPQAAVGAIWRAQRVLSIGDPFQIDPICTVPAEVIDGMAKNRIGDKTLSWAPSQVSVQNLMDRATIFGTMRTTREESYWLGSPLRVHRRCLEPMFAIANAIAYENNMLFATEAAEELSLPPSCWWDVPGHAATRQYVPAQGNALLHLLLDAFHKMSSPDIYIISPFREVIFEIQLLLQGNEPLRTLFRDKFPNIPLQIWIRQAVGTVHTFQGKQAAVVFFVLGADKSTLSAVQWASRKPNLLNVAVTRAQSRFYIIGSYDLWRSWPYFDIAAQKLERRSLNLKPS